MGQWNRSVQVSTHSKWDNGTGQYMSVFTISGTMEQVSTGQYSQYAGQGTGEQVNTCQYSQFAGQLNMSVLTVCRTRERVSTHSMQDKGTGQYTQYAGQANRSTTGPCR